MNSGTPEGGDHKRDGLITLDHFNPRHPGVRMGVDATPETAEYLHIMSNGSYPGYIVGGHDVLRDMGDHYQTTAYAYDKIPDDGMNKFVFICDGCATSNPCGPGMSLV